MGGMDMGFVNEPSMCGEKTTCPQWMAGEQLYNCENFTKTLRKAGFNLDRLFKQMRLSEQHIAKMDMMESQSSIKTAF